MLLIAVAMVAWWAIRHPRAQFAADLEESLPRPAPVDEDQIEQLCSHCHRRPQPEVLPKSAWPRTVWLMSTFGGFGSNVAWEVHPQAVVEWFQRRAPDSLELRRQTGGPRGDRKLPMTRHGISSPRATSVPFVSHILLADVVGSVRPELVVCDMKNGVVLMGRTEQPDWALEPIAGVAYPAHAEAADMDGDGRMDLVVANLGSYSAMDHTLGSVEWLRQTEDGRFDRVTLADDLGRVADVEPADIDGDGDLDIVVAEFGWRWTGHLILLKNSAGPGKPPDLVSCPIEGLHGASHVDVADLDGDGHLDIVALYSQEQEMVRCYLNRQNQWTEIRDLYRAPHPAWGHTGMQLVDLDQDTDLDILLTNGDTYDNSSLKPYHGVRWLENKGSLDFEPHELVRMYGAYRAEAADMDGNGTVDVVACALVERDDVEGQADLDRFESILWMDQAASGKFVHRSFELSECRHPTLTLGDYDLDGDVDLFVGFGQFDDIGYSPGARCLDLWENETKQPVVRATPGANRR